VFGAEVIGTPAPAADAEVVILADRYLRERGLRRFTLLLNSIGDQTCRPAYRELLLEHLRANREDLTDEHRQTFERNPLRVLDCKDEACRAVAARAPRITDHLCEACAHHLADVRAALEEEGVEYRPEPTLVRGLDYYTRTAFEFESDALPGQQSTVCGGGRYDGLAEVLGGEATPGVGFGLGLDRLLIALEAEGGPGRPSGAVTCFVVAIGEEAAAVGRSLIRDLRAAGIPAEGAYEPRPLKGQLRQADRAGASHALIVGEREVADGTVTVRRLADGEQESVRTEDVVTWISGRA
jgi:histidyl-tRNA synthetase